MGRNAAIARIPHYREVLVATAVRALRDRLPAVSGVETGRRAWLAVEAGAWRAVAIAAGAVAYHAAPR